MIEYGANLNKFIDTKSDIELDKINPKINYRLLHKSFFVVARLEPENNIEMIIKGYKIKKRRYPLVIIGNLNTKHSKKIIKYKSDDVIFLEESISRKFTIIKVKLFGIYAWTFSWWN